jgi:signal transduction histidine kinase
VVVPYYRLFHLFIYILLIVLVLHQQTKQQHAEEKNRYFTNTAHDIRTSLTLIKAPVDELSHETNLSARGKHFLKLATEQTNRLANVITQLMDFQKADIGKEKLIMKMTDVVELVKYRTEMVEPLCKTKNIKLIFKTNTNHYETAIDDIQFEKE